MGGGLIHAAVGIWGGFGGCLTKRWGVGLVSGVENGLSGGVDFIGLPEMDLVGGHQANARMVVMAIVPVEKGAKERSGVFDAAKAFWKLQLVFQCLEVAFPRQS